MVECVPDEIVDHAFEGERGLTDRDQAGHAFAAEGAGSGPGIYDAIAVLVAILGCAIGAICGMRAVCTVDHHRCHFSDTEAARGGLTNRREPQHCRG
ncbi:MAG: hypothetical protein WCE35_06710 [Bradyrhizobium sp.]